MKAYRWFSLVVVAALLVGAVGVLPSKDVAADSTYQTLPFSQNWSNTALITTDDDWSGVPGIVGYRGDGLTSSTGTDPQTLLSDDSPGVVDVNANQTNPNTYTTGGVTEFDLTDDVVALAGSGTADAPYLLIHLNTTGYANIRVQYNLRDIDGSTDNSVQQVALHYRVGTSGNFTNVPAAYVADASSGPSLATQVTPVDVTLPSNANNQAQVQLRIMTTNAGGNDEYIGVDDISITGQPIPYHSITLDANVSEWGTTEKLGTASSTDFYVTWDDDFWYFGVNGGFADTDFFMIGIDSDPTNETSNTGGTAERCGATFPDENKPNYILVNRQNSYTRESWGWNGSAWDQTAWNPSETSEYNFSGTSGTYEVKLKKSTVFGTNEDTSPVAFYLWLSNGSCQIFNAWPSENRNGWTGSNQFLYAHSRFDTTDSGHTPNTYGARVAWATNTLSANSTTYNYFGEDDSGGGNPWLRLTTTASGAGGASCTVRAKMVGTNSFTQPTFEGINRFVDFTLTNCTGLQVDVQMRYEESELNGVNEANTTFYRCAAAPCSAAWAAVSGGTYTRDTTNNNLLLTNVAQDQFSYWTIGDLDVPTALTLTDFTARSAMNTALLASLALIMLGVSAAALRRRM